MPWISRHSDSIWPTPWHPVASMYALTLTLTLTLTHTHSRSHSSHSTLILTMSLTHKSVWGHPWYRGTALNCWSTGRAINPAPGHDPSQNSPHSLRLSQVQYSLNGGLKHHSFIKVCLQSRYLHYPVYRFSDFTLITPWYWNWLFHSLISLGRMQHNFLQL